MIKKLYISIISFIIVGLGLFNFSNSAWNIRQNFNYQNSTLDNNIELNVVAKGQLLSQRLGNTKRMLAFSSSDGYKIFFFWSYNQKPYYYVNYAGHNFQGFLNYYYLCDYFTGDSIGGNCAKINITDNFVNENKNFFQSITNEDERGYNIYTWNCYGSNQLINQVAFGASRFDKVIMFSAGAGSTEGCFCTDCGNTSGSLGLLPSTDFTFVNDSYLNTPPGMNGADRNGDDEENNTNTNTESNYACPTVAQVMQSMGSNYNTGLCYNNTSYFNGTSFEQIEKEDIFTIFNDNYQNYTNRISTYRNNCTNANTSQACQIAFSGEYKKYSIIGNANNSKVDEKKLRNYCNLGLNYDPNTTTCVISGGGIKEPYTNEELLNNIINNGIIPTPSTNQQDTGNNENNVLNSLNKCEDGDRDCYVNNRNFIDSLKNIYGKITGLFKERNGVNGIIPNYILRITFLTILFTVIFKK